MRMYSLKAGSFNALGNHHSDPGGKDAGFASGRWRARMATALFLRLMLDVVGLQETEVPQLNTFRRAKARAYGAWRAAPNDHRRWGSSGNALAWLRAKWSVIETFSLQVPVYSGGHEDGLHFAVALIRHRFFPRRAFVAISGHHPSRGPVSGGSNADREKCWVEVRDYAARCVAVGLPVIYLSDVNQHDGVSEDVRRTGMEIMAFGAIDLVAATHNCHRAWGKVIENRFVGRLTDHGRIVFAKIRVPIQKSRDLPALPR